VDDPFSWLNDRRDWRRGGRRGHVDHGSHSRYCHRVFLSTTITQSHRGSLGCLGERQKSILDSIVHALRYMHRDKMEPDFIKRYRADYVTSPAVQENLYSIMDEDGKWDQMVHAREKVEGILTAITSDAKKEEEGDAGQENVIKLTEILQAAQAKLDETLKQSSDIKEQLKEFTDLATNMDVEDEDDEDLFGKDDDDEEEDEVSRTVVCSEWNNARVANYMVLSFIGKTSEEEAKGKPRIALEHP
jgi:hypothetical protein